MAVLSLPMKPATVPRRRRVSLPSAAVAACVSVIALVPLPGTAVFTGSVISFLLLFPVYVRFISGKRHMVGLALVCLALTALSPIAAAIASGSLEGLPRWDWVARPVALFVSVITMSWCVEKIGVRPTILLAIPGPLLFDLITRSGQGNTWKYAVSIWVTVGVLVLVGNWRLPWKILAVSAVIIASALNDTRGLIAMVAVGAAVDIVTRTSSVRTHRVLLSVVGSVALAITAFQLAIVGAFGAHIQTTMQLQTQSGPMSLFRTARPESGGNISLVFSDPIRFVISDAVTANQAAIIQNSFAQVNRDPNSFYVMRNVLNDAELHSVASDLWLHLGFIGVLLSVLATIFFLKLGIRAFSINSGLTAVIVFVSMRGVWDLLFSPISDLRLWPLYLCLGLYFFGYEESTDEYPR